MRLTIPLLTSADGTKFGKSTGGGSLWLDPEMTSPYAWYQYFINTADADVVRYLRWFTFLSADEIAELQEATTDATARAGGATTAGRASSPRSFMARRRPNAVEHASQALFGRGELSRLDEPTLAAALQEASVAELTPGAPDGIVDLLGRHRACRRPRAAARRTIAEGGVSVNNRDRQRGVVARADGLPPRAVAGAAPGQAEYCRGRAC